MLIRKDCIGSTIYMTRPKETYSKSLFDRHIDSVNALPLELRLLPPRLPKRKLEKMTVPPKD